MLRRSHWRGPVKPYAFTSMTYCWLSFGFFLRSHTAAVSAGGCCRIALQHRERPVLGLGDIDIEAAMVRLGVDGRLARGTVEDVSSLSSAAMTFIRSTLPAFFTADAHRCIP